MPTLFLSGRHLIKQNSSKSLGWTGHILPSISNCSITNLIFKQRFIARSWLTDEGDFYAFMAMDVTFWCIVTYSRFFLELWPYVINKHGLCFCPYITLVVSTLIISDIYPESTNHPTYHHGQWACYSFKKSAQMLASVLNYDLLLQNQKKGGSWRNFENMLIEPFDWYLRMFNGTDMLISLE